ncbi:MAG: AzlD domain-containing protein [Casimicrobiaceae bacterium]
MGSIEGWVAILGLAVGTFAIRYSFIGFLAGRTMPPWFERVMRLAVLAIFAALVVPLVVLDQGRLALELRAPHLIAALATAFVAGWRGGTVLPLIVGMTTLHLATHVLS